MVASCALAFDFVPPRPIVVVDARARFPLMESGEFGLPIPTRALAAQTLAVTSQLARASLPESKSFAPMSQGCAAWLKCRAISDASQRFDVILGEVIEACSKAPIYAANRRHLRRDPMDRTSYCVASGQSFGTGAFFRTKTDTN
jgi:flavin reductase (DIM6/NTAB) family NADH-FMN oxidoreductase RutF